MFVHITWYGHTRIIKDTRIYVSYVNGNKRKISQSSEETNKNLIQTTKYKYEGGKLILTHT